MLDTATKFESAFDRIFEIDPSYGAYFRSEMEDDVEESTRKRKRSARVLGAPSYVDWENARNMVEYLKIFSDVTTKISGSKYVTSNIFFSELVKMQATITRMCLSTDYQKKNMANSMKEKYEKYWDNLDNMNFLLYVAVVLDPRFKLRYVTFCIDTIYGKGTNKNREILGKVKSTLDELFEHYKIRFEKINVGKTYNCTSSNKSSSCGGTTIDLELEFQKFVDEEQDTKNEVDTYLADGSEKTDGHFDILGWWKANSMKFPVLSMLARHVLAMPISTVASESAFSTGGRVIDKYRSSLSTKTAEALICTQDWIRNTTVDLEFGGTMLAKDIEEMNEKLKNFEIDVLSKGKKAVNDDQHEMN